MNPGLTEEGAKIATGLVDSLKTQPATLAMIVISFGLLGYTFYEGSAFNAQRQAMFRDLMDQQNKFAILLSKCIVPDRTKLRLPPLPEPLPLTSPMESTEREIHHEDHR